MDTFETSDLRQKRRLERQFHLKEMERNSNTNNIRDSMFPISTFSSSSSSSHASSCSSSFSTSRLLNINHYVGLDDYDEDDGGNNESEIVFQPPKPLNPLTRKSRDDEYKMLHEVNLHNIEDISDYDEISGRGSNNSGSSGNTFRNFNDGWRKANEKVMRRKLNLLLFAAILLVSSTILVYVRKHKIRGEFVSVMIEEERDDDGDFSFDNITNSSSGESQNSSNMINDTMNDGDVEYQIVQQEQMPVPTPNPTMVRTKPTAPENKTVVYSEIEKNNENSTSEHVTEEETMKDEKKEPHIDRASLITSVIRNSQLTSPSTLSYSTQSPQFRALDWLIYHDPARLHIEHEHVIGMERGPARELVERYALAVLYFATSGKDVLENNRGGEVLEDEAEEGTTWKQRTGGWMRSSFSVCLWHGVHCSPQPRLDELGGHGEEISASSVAETKSMLRVANTKNHNKENGGIVVEDYVVTSLNLMDNGLNGTIPSELRALKDLKRLYLAKNSLVGEIPTMMGNFKRLETLYLDQNLLDGIVPETIGNLKKLQSFQMHKNNIKGTIPKRICDLKRLERITSDCSTMSINKTLVVPKVDCECCTQCY